MEPEWLRKCIENRALVREASGRASGSDLGAIWTSPDASGSAPGAPGGPQELHSELREAQNEPQEGQNEPREARNEPQECPT